MVPDAVAGDDDEDGQPAANAPKKAAKKKPARAAESFTAAGLDGERTGKRAKR